MPGFAHIFRLGQQTGTYGKTIFEYQLNYTIAGDTYARVFEDAELEQFLRSNLGLTPEAVETTLRDLRELGKATVAGVDIPSHELPAMGLQQVPSDY